MRSDRSGSTRQGSTRPGRGDRDGLLPPFRSRISALWMSVMWAWLCSWNSWWRMPFATRRSWWLPNPSSDVANG